MLRTPHPAANRVRYQPLFAVQQTRFLLAESVVCLRCLSGHWLQERPSAHIELSIIMLCRTKRPKPPLVEGEADMARQKGGQMDQKERGFAIKATCCTAAMCGKSISESIAPCSPEYRDALRSLLMLSPEAWGSREYAWANSGYEIPCQGERPCKDCILDRQMPVHIPGSPEE